MVLIRRTPFVILRSQGMAFAFVFHLQVAEFISHPHPATISFHPVGTDGALGLTSAYPIILVFATQ